MFVMIKKQYHENTKKRKLAVADSNFANIA